VGTQEPSFLSLEGRARPVQDPRCRSTPTAFPRHLGGSCLRTTLRAMANGRRAGSSARGLDPQRDPSPRIDPTGRDTQSDRARCHRPWLSPSIGRWTARTSGRWAVRSERYRRGRLWHWDRNGRWCDGAGLSTLLRHRVSGASLDGSGIVGPRGGGHSRARHSRVELGGSGFGGNDMSPRETPMHRMSARIPVPLVIGASDELCQ
jgi:hypothetical protein